MHELVDAHEFPEVSIVDFTDGAAGLHNLCEFLAKLAHGAKVPLHNESLALVKLVPVPENEDHPHLCQDLG